MEGENCLPQWVALGGERMVTRCPLPRLPRVPFRLCRLAVVVSFRGVLWVPVRPVRRGYMAAVRTAVPVLGVGKQAFARLLALVQL